MSHLRGGVPLIQLDGPQKFLVSRCPSGTLWLDYIEHVVRASIRFWAYFALVPFIASELTAVTPGDAINST